MNVVNLLVVLAVLLSTAVFSTKTILMPSLSINDMLILFAIGLASALFYVFWYLGCQHISGAAAGLFTAVMPVATLLIAWLFLGETILIVQMLGILLVLISIVLNAIQQKRVHSRLP